jgi:hypothetical protein
VFGSWNVKKAWCGLFPVLPSVAVRTILRVSVDERLREFDVSGDPGVSLHIIHQLYTVRFWLGTPYFSFMPPPTPEPLPWMVNVASSKLQALAANTAEVKERAAIAAHRRNLMAQRWRGFVAVEQCKRRKGTTFSSFNG